MSEYSVINAVNKTLKELLWSLIKVDSNVSSIITTEDKITFDPPFKLARENETDQNYLSLYLYRIVENGEMKNRPLEAKDTHLLQYPPLSLNLFYLITPLTNSAENDHMLLGKTMHIFYDNAILKGSALKDILENTEEELRIILNPISMEDMTKLWSSFMKSYRLSLSYEVKVVTIESGRETEAERVRRKKLIFTHMTGA